MSIDADKYEKELSDRKGQHNSTNQEIGKVDEITIVIRGGKVVKFEQRVVGEVCTARLFKN
ncbi:hypothetical protein SDC9_184485 [bioreactor metagenome]|uniref:Uncharacterized protein n=1 Tax=bioreactor metagenome TaxID=1076179 RepID=A0A645HNE8_9ZZZZ